MTEQHTEQEDPRYAWHITKDYTPIPLHIVDHPGYIMASQGAKLFYLRLWMACDSHGSFPADPVTILAKVYSLEIAHRGPDAPRKEQIQEWLAELVARNLVEVYGSADLHGPAVYVYILRHEVAGRLVKVPPAKYPSHPNKPKLPKGRQAGTNEETAQPPPHHNKPDKTKADQNKSKHGPLPPGCYYSLDGETIIQGCGTPDTIDDDVACAIKFPHNGTSVALCVKAIRSGRYPPDAQAAALAKLQSLGIIHADGSPTATWFPKTLEEAKAGPPADDLDAAVEDLQS